MSRGGYHRMFMAVEEFVFLVTVLQSILELLFFVTDQQCRAARQWFYTAMLVLFYNG